jgi:hypothetical protein
MARPRPGWKPKKGFQPGNCANPRGRAAGSHDKHPCSVWQVLEQRGDRTAIDLLSEVANSNLVDMNLRIQAMGMLASYQSGKRPAYRYVQGVVEMPAPHTLEEARQYLGRLSMLVATGRLDADSGQAIAALLREYIDATIGTDVLQRLQILEEQVRAQAERGGTTVIVQSDLGRMPGTEALIMPGDPPAIEGKPNPWSAPDVRSSVDVVSKPPGTPPSDSDNRS